MARKRHLDEDILKLLREIEVKLSAGSDVQSACRGVGTLGEMRRLWPVEALYFVTQGVTQVAKLAIK